jgi:hypothetical protein
MTSLPLDFEVMKAMQTDSLQCEEGCHPLGWKRLGEIIEARLAVAVD